jgi:hypothetical protein
VFGIGNLSYNGKENMKIFKIRLERRTFYSKTGKKKKKKKNKQSFGDNYITKSLTISALR